MSELHIRAREPDDSAGITDLLNQPGYRFGTLRLPWTSRSEVERRLSQPVTDGSLYLVAELDGRIVGNASLSVRTGRERHCGEIGMGVHDQYWRRGIGRALMQALISHADNWLGLLRLELFAYSDNIPAITLYRSLGFVEEGCLRRSALRDGLYVDALVMGRLQPAPSDQRHQN